MALNQVLTGPQISTDGQIITARGGKTGEAVVTEIHGKFYEASVRGNVFTASTIIAGVVVPVAAATLNSKFTLWNPAGSGKNVELISMHLCTDGATTVVNVHGLMIQRGLTLTSGIPTSVGTLCAVSPAGIGSVNSSVVTVAAQATLTNVAIPGVNAAVSIPFWPIGSYGAVTNSGANDLTHNFDGKLILGPDSLVAACTTVAATTASFVQICWAEWPI